MRCIGGGSAYSYGPNCVHFSFLFAARENSSWPKYPNIQKKRIEGVKRIEVLACTFDLRFFLLYLMFFRPSAIFPHCVHCFTASARSRIGKQASNFETSDQSK